MNRLPLPPALLAALLAPMTLSAQAATFVVDSSSDSGALTACTAAPADCSLRGAITRANAAIDADEIVFDIPLSDPGCSASTGVCRIAVAADFSVTQPLTIDGYTQPGAQPNTIPAPGAHNAQLRIEITHAPGFNSFRLFEGQGAFTLRGVAMFLPSGAMISGARPRFVLQGNWFGVTAAGTTPDYSGNGHVLALSVCTASEVLVGGPDPADRNVIAGSGRDVDGLPGGGSAQVCAATGSLRVQGNLIGLAPDGITPLPLRDAFQIRSQQNVSPPAPVAQIDFLDNRLVRPVRNFSGGFGGGLRFTASALMDRTARIEGNVFGLAVDGSRIGVERDHIVLDAGSGANGHAVRIGGLGAGEGNVFAAAIAQPSNSPALGSVAFVQNGLPLSRIEVVGNTLLGNAGIGLDFPHATAGGGVAIGRTPNDAGDADSGANHLQNHPQILAYSVGGGTFSVRYRVDTAPANASYPLRVDFYRALGDEGERLLDSDVYLESEAQAEKQVSLSIPPGVSLSADDVLVAIATDAEGRSSEFSFDTATITVADTPDPWPAGLPFEVEVMATATSGPFKPNGVAVVNLPTTPPARCEAALQPTATPNVSRGVCSLIAPQVGTRTLTASYDALRGAFASATGGNLSATTSHTATDPGPEQVGFSGCRATALEGRVFEAVVQRPSGGVANVSLQLRHEAGSASPGVDYTPPADQVLNWAPGDLAPKRIAIAIAADADGEPDESFRLRLSDPVGAALLPFGLLEVRIVDGAVRGFADGFEGSCPQ